MPVPIPRPKRTVFVWICILGPECQCVQDYGVADQFCANTRRREVEDEDHEEASQKEAPLLPDVQTAQDARCEPLECQRA